LGLLLVLLIVFVEDKIRKIPLWSIVGGVTGLIIGIFIALMLAYILHLVVGTLDNQKIITWLFLFLFSAIVYLGLGIGSKKFNESKLFYFFIPPEKASNKKLLDTSVIIDGRIVDICKAGFLEGKLLLPKFVIDELHYIADSSETLRRSRGRRGLDILNLMKSEKTINMEIIEDDPHGVKGVDRKLIALAKLLNAQIITNDFNLNKVAALQEVKVLNLNELANTLKPVVLPGETIKVQISKEGKESEQGVGYLDDGTMIVVEHGSDLIGMTLEVIVTSVLQTSAGRMIFAELEAEKRG